MKLSLHRHLSPWRNLAAAGRERRAGVALVITLILLSVITFMAVTFLVISRRESEQVDTLSQQNNAKNAAAIATDYAEAQVIAQMQAIGNGYNFGAFVSTNLITTNFITAGNPGANNITNVAYNYANGLPLSQADLLMMLNNLLVLPRAPVFITTNRNQPPDFRFFLNENRNVDRNGNPVYDPNNTVMVLTNDSGFLVTNVFMGDPEYIAGLDHPDMPHSSSNWFVYRFAFMALPIGNSLDFNAMHNHVKQQIAAANDGYLRDQGVGSWEINMAGLLYGLNSNVWTYNAYEFNNMFVPSSQFAFQDAASLLQYRCNGNYGNLRTFGNMYGAQAANLAANGYVDLYSSAQPQMTNLSPLTTPPNDLTTVTTVPWSGADNPNQLFSPQDLFNGGSTIFSNHLYSIGLSTNGVDRYAFYNLLSQASFASAPEAYPYPYISKLNLNYVNVGGVSATNFVPWLPVQFFTNAAIRLLRSRPEFLNAGVCSGGSIYIPIYPTNFYTPSLHRMLQLAANIYDAGTNKTVSDGFDHPSVFRPTFGVSGTNIFINGYVEEGAGTLDYQTLPLSLPEQASAVTASTVNIYGVPWVIGAKRGFPNFNQVGMQSVSQLTRKVQLVKSSVTAPHASWQTNIQYTIGVSNVLGVEAWNSYTNILYTRPIDIFGVDILTMALTNELGVITNWTWANANTPGMSWLYTLNQWPSYPYSTSANGNAPSFQIPLLTNLFFISNLVYHPTSVPRLTTGTNFDVTAPGYPQPHFGLNVTNRLRFALVDHASKRVIDFVEFNAMDVNRDLLSEATGTGTDTYGPGGVWDTNRLNNSLSTSPILGVIAQINISQNYIGPSFKNGNYQTLVTQNDWNNAQYQQGLYSTVAAAVSNFHNFYNNIGTDLITQVPFTPTRKVSYYTSWQANDPLVHYTLGDLAVTPATNYWSLTGQNTNLMGAFGQQINQRYSPWGGNPLKLGSDPYATQIAVKDPLVYTSDYWQFPTNKYPSLGWLGRVHRGTPWQTIYLKSPGIDPANWQGWVGSTNYNWQTWIGNRYTNYNGTNLNTLDSMITQPTNDWKILDLFTTSPNENASRGQLSINQPNPAAWSAILDGVFVVSNVMTATTTNIVGFPIDPYTNYTALTNLITSINNQRGSYTGGVFTNLGDILSVPQLTVASPFLNTIGTPSSANQGLNDAAYERIPQQILSLLRVGTPRYVIFAYGQALKPANNSIVTSGPYFGLCTNYQIMAEFATRTVVRFEPINPSALGYQPAYPANLASQLKPVVESFAVLPPE